MATLTRRNAQFLAGLQTMDPRDLVLLGKLVVDPRVVEAMGAELCEPKRPLQLWAMIAGGSIAAQANIVREAAAKALGEEAGR